GPSRPRRGGPSLPTLLARHVITSWRRRRDDWDEAYRCASAVSPTGQLASHVPNALWLIMELVEAPARSGRYDEAAAHVAAAREAHIGEVGSCHFRHLCRLPGPGRTASPRGRRQTRGVSPALVLTGHSARSGDRSAGHPVTGCDGVLFGAAVMTVPAGGVPAGWFSVAVRPAAGEWPGAVRRVIGHPASGTLAGDGNRSCAARDTGGLRPHGWSGPGRPVRQQRLRWQ